MPRLDQTLLLSYLFTLLPVDSSNGLYASSALDWPCGRSRRPLLAAGKWPWRLHCDAGGVFRQELDELKDQLGINSELRLTLLAEAKEYRMSQAKRKHLEASWDQEREVRH